MSKKETSIFDLDDFSYGKKFAIMGRLYLAAMAKQLKHLGIEKHFSVIILIDKMGDRCSQKFIASKLHIDKALMVGVLDDLSKKGFIKRTPNPDDRREYWIQLTAKGKKSVPDINEMVDCLNNSIVKDLKSAEVKKFNKHLESIYKGLLEATKC